LELKPIKYEIAKEEPKERILPEHEIRRLIENSEAPLRHIILVAFNTGMRKSEILNLEWRKRYKEWDRRDAGMHGFCDKIKPREH
jgi:integrase